MGVWSVRWGCGERDGGVESEMGVWRVNDIYYCQPCMYVLVFFSKAGLYFCFSKLTDQNIFIILYGVTSIYFAVSHTHRH